MQFYYLDYLVIVKYKKNKNIYFRLNNDLSIIVTCPKSLEVSKIKQYLSTFINKIENKYDMEEYLNVKYHLNDGYIYYLGSKYYYDVYSSNKNNVKRNKDSFEVYLKDENDLKKVIDDYLLKESKKLLTYYFEEAYSKFEHVNFDVELKVSKMKARFGVCYPQKKVITLSSQLLHYDLDSINYVIVHELAHFIQPNHSKKFYYLIEEYIPNYKMIEKKLKKIKIQD